MADTRENPKKVPRISEGGDDGKEGVDRLSNLPISILHHIFSFMDTVDVIKMSAVSRKWRYMWVSMPSLSFSVLHKIWSEKRTTWSIRTVNDEFKDFINWVLMSQNGSVGIKSFLLRGYYNYADDYTLHRWLNVLVRRNVRELELIIFLDTPFELPHCLITCESLISLTLRFGTHSVLKLPAGNSFSSLKFLFLTNVELTDCISFQNFISSCPLLEDLTMRGCVFRELKILDISSASLKILVIDNGYADPGGDGLRGCELKVACPSLVSFYFNSPLAKDFHFEDLNSLQSMFLSVDSLTEHVGIDDCHHIMHKIFKGIHSVTVLKLPAALHDLCIQFLHLTLIHPECFHAPLYNLKSLKLAVLPDEWSMKLIFCLLIGFPNLEALTIYFIGSEFSEYNMRDMAIPCLTDHLKMVEMYEVNGDKNELELVRFLLKNGRALDKMSISCVTDVKNHSHIASEVMQFPRTSSNIALKFLKPKLQVDFVDL